jgi:tetratricopeptide (TPR) repeat protein
LSGSAERARALLRSGDPAAALALLDTALVSEPRNRGLRLDRATALRELGRLDEAEAVYTALLADKPDLAPALIGLGHSARRRGAREAALGHFAAAAAADPGNPWPAVESGHLLRDLDRIVEAERAYAVAAALKPDLVPALIGLGHCARRRGDRAAARGHFAEAARLAPANLAARLEVATECRELGELDAARDAARAVLDSEPGHLNALMNLGLTERRAGRREAARDAFAAAAAAHPAETRPLIEQAAETLALGEALAAETLLRRAARLAPSDPAPLEALAEQARIAGRLEDALALCGEAVERAPASLPARLALAQTLFDLGRMAEAEAALEAATAALDRRHRPALRARQVMLRRRAGDLHGALALARAAHAEAPEAFAAWQARCQVEALLITDAAALEACFAAAPARGAVEQAAVAVCRGDAAELRGDPDAATRHLEDALRLNPLQPHPHHVLARLALRRWDIAAMRHHLGQAMRLEAGSIALQARRNKLSQSLMGQILDDVSIDASLTAALAALHTLPPQEQIAPIAELVRQNGEATAPALALLMALRRTAPLLGRPAPAGVPPIPRTIGQFWDSPTPPADVLALMEGWRTANPGYAIQRFDDAGAVAFLASRFARPVLEAFRRAPEPTMRADLMRLAWLRVAGGIWVDADDRCLRPLATLIPEGAALFGYQEDVGSFGNNLLAAVPGHPVIAVALELAVTAVLRGDEDTVWLSTGPGVLTRALAGIVAGRADTALQLPPGTVILDRLEVFPAVAMHVATSYKAAKRHWMSAFRRRPGRARAEAGSPATAA